MSYTNARASLNKLVASLADEGVPVLTQARQPWRKECYRVEWLDAEVPRGANRFARNVRIHVQGHGELDQELRLQRMIDGLQLGDEATIAAHTLYNYAADQVAPAAVGSYHVERSAQGMRVMPATLPDPELYRLAITLVVVYPR